MEFEVKDVELIVRQVLQNVLSQGELSQAQEIKTYKPEEKVTPTLTKYNGYGVFERMEEAIDAAYLAQETFVKDYQLKDREKLIHKIREVCRENAHTLAKMVSEETKIGRYEDKVQKHLLVVEKTPGTECLKTEALSGDHGLMIVEHAPFGVIGAITPITNPTETIINNVLSMIAGGNSVVFNVHPSTKACCKFCVELINKAIEEVNGPRNLVTMVREPSMETVKILGESKKVKLLVGTGGMQMVRSLMTTGKKVIGAGAGNPPVIVDATADIAHAAKEIYKGASFDNNILCLSEKEVFVEAKVATDFMYQMVTEGAFLLTKEQLKKVMDLVLVTVQSERDNTYQINKQWVGQDAAKILQAIGIEGKSDTKLIICEVEHNHPFVLLEQLMPILPIVKCNNLEEAIAYAVEAEHRYRHTASMFSKNIDHLTRFAREVQTTLFVKNASTLAGVGFNGEGHTTMTIAGPTGEGVTNALSFTRQRRCVLAEGGFRII